MKASRLNILVEKYLADDMEPEELNELRTAFQNDSSRPEWEALVREAFLMPSEEAVLPVSPSEAMVARMQSAIKAEEKIAPVVPMRKRFPKIAVAAVFVLAMAGGAYWYFTRAGLRVQHETAIQEPGSDVLPGGDKAVLQLADGRVVALEEEGAAGEIAVQSGMRVSGTEPGVLTYENAEGEAGAALTASSWNTLTTPRGGQYRLVLSDGTKVWLNAASSIRFPASFQPSERKVFIEGEVYFEVEKNEASPFVVAAKGAEVEVLGTRFNVMAYAEEPLRTTLAEGSVRLRNGEETVLMQPGDVAEWRNDEEIFTVAPANIPHEMAWKNGRFSFYKAETKFLLRQIARWYDVELVYENEPAVNHIMGDISRNEPLSKVLRYLALSGIQTELKENKLIVK